MNLKYPVGLTVIKNLLFLLFNSKNTFSSLNVSVFDWQASYFREKCIDECATVSSGVVGGGRRGPCPPRILVSARKFHPARLFK